MSETTSEKRTLSQRERSPWLRILIGRCGSGKTTIGRMILQAWAEDRPDDDPGWTLVVDPVATNPPGELHLAAAADRFTPEPPPEFPPGVDIIGVDEADLSLHQGDARAKNPPPLHGLVRRRRHAGVSVLLLTQRPALIARDAWALADEIIICNVTDSEDLKRIGKLSGVTKDHLHRIASMSEPGIALIWRPDGVVAP